MNSSIRKRESRCSNIKDLSVSCAVSRERESRCLEKYITSNISNVIAWLSRARVTRDILNRVTRDTCTLRASKAHARPPFKSFTCTMFRYIQTSYLLNYYRRKFYQICTCNRFNKDSSI